MYYTEKITPDILKKLQSEEGNREYKTGPGNRIVVARVCNHCSSQFFPKRKNQKFDWQNYQEAAFLNDQAGNWFKVISQNPVQLTSIHSPFQQK